MKSVVFGCEVRIMSLITDGVTNRASKMTVMRSVRSEIDRLKFLNRLEQGELWDFATSYYRHCVAGANRKVDVPARMDAIYSVLRKDTPMLEHVKNEIVDNVEYRKKHKDLVLKLRDDDNKFFYCTVLKDAASDHAAYQGLFYFKRSGVYSDEEKEFILAHKLMSVEDVVLGRPWLTTRRNCRHTLVPVSFSDVKNGYSESERSFHEISYEEEQYRVYRDRYKMMVEIKKVFEKNESIPSQLKVDMKRTRSLALQWNRARKEAEKKSDR